MKGKCEIFNKGRCFGCIGLAQDNIDELKLQCKTYKDEMKEDNNGTLDSRRL